MIPHTHLHRFLVLLIDIPLTQAFYHPIPEVAQTLDVVRDSVVMVIANKYLIQFLNGANFLLSKFWISFLHGIFRWSIWDHLDAVVP